MQAKNSTEQAILQQRAELLAKPVQEVNNTAEQLLLCFYVHEEKYALDNSVVYKVIPSLPITPLPFVQNEFAGIVFYAGMLWPVLDSGQFFTQQTAVAVNQMILISNNTQRIALTTDGIIDQVTYAGQSDLMTVTTHQMHRSEFIAGVFGQDTAVINDKTLLNWLKTLNLKHT